MKTRVFRFLILIVSRQALFKINNCMPLLNLKIKGYEV